MNRADKIVFMGCLVAFAVFSVLGLAGKLPGQCSRPGAEQTLACAR